MQTVYHKFLKYGISKMPRAKNSRIKSDIIIKVDFCFLRICCKKAEMRGK